MPQGTRAGWGPWVTAGAAPPIRSGPWGPKGIGMRLPPPPSAGSMPRGVLAAPWPSPVVTLWKRWKLLSQLRFLSKHQLLFGRDSHLTHFDPTASCPPAFHCPWSGECPLPPDVPTPAMASPLGSHPLFQASEPVLPVNTALALRPPHGESSLVPEPVCPWLFAFPNHPLVRQGQAGKCHVAVSPKPNPWTLFSSHLDPKDLSLDQEGIISTAMSGREGANNHLELCSLDLASAMHFVNGLSQPAFDPVTEHRG